MEALCATNVRYFPPFCIGLRERLFLRFFQHLLAFGFYVLILTTALILRPAHVRISCIGLTVVLDILLVGSES